MSTGGTPVIGMEFLDHGNLKDHLKNFGHELNQERVITLCQDVSKQKPFALPVIYKTKMT